MSLTPSEIKQYRKTKADRERRHRLRKDPKWLAQYLERARRYQRERKLRDPKGIAASSRKWYLTGGKQTLEKARQKRLSDPKKYAIYLEKARMYANARYKRIKEDKKEWEKYLSQKTDYRKRRKLRREYDPAFDKKVFEQARKHTRNWREKMKRENPERWKELAWGRKVRYWQSSWKKLR